MESQILKVNFKFFQESQNLRCSLKTEWILTFARKNLKFVENYFWRLGTKLQASEQKLVTLKKQMKIDEKDTPKKKSSCQLMKKSNIIDYSEAQRAA